MSRGVAFLTMTHSGPSHLRRLQRALAFRVSRLSSSLKDRKQARQLTPHLTLHTARLPIEGLTVVTLVRNSMPWLPPFLAHYRALGANRFVFCDTGSSDGTLGYLCDQSDAMVLSSALPFGDWNRELRRYLAMVYAPTGWVMNVDSDEFFLHPFAERVPLNHFLDYLDAHRYTAVIGQMLEMLPARPLCSLKGDELLRREEHFPGYSLSGMTHEQYHEHNVSVSNRTIPTLKGGIRSVLFPGTNPMLTKHPLIRLDRGARIVDQHRISHARVADVSCVLLHYKFTACLRHQIDDAIREGQYYDKSFEYRTMKASLEVREVKPFLGAKDPTIWHSTESLVEQKFLHISSQYRTALGRHGQKELS